MTDLTADLHQPITVTPALANTARISLYNIFTPEELVDLIDAAQERGRSIRGLIHDAVTADLVR